MNTKRVFASLCLAASSCALFTAASVSVGDQPGVVRLTAGQQGSPPVPPVPPAREVPVDTSDSASGGAASDAGTASMVDLAPPVPPSSNVAVTEGAASVNGNFVSPSAYDPYFQPSGGVTEAPVLGRLIAPENHLFGPSVSFESNFEDGLGFSDAFHRASVRLPYHLEPGVSVLTADLAASVTNRGNYAYNFGAIFRRYDESRDRVFGWNAYFDLDDGQGNEDWQRLGFGIESLGRFLDFRANGYYVSGDDTFLVSDSSIGELVLSGNGAFQVRNQVRENAYSGFDAETGGPLPVLGRRGINGYVGAYYLDNDTGFSTVGVSARVEALISDSVTANFRYTDDDTFGANAYVSVSYDIPSYRQRAIFQPRRSVRSRLADPVGRSARIHTNIDAVSGLQAIVNSKTNRDFRLAYVDPNRTEAGTGTLEDPFGSLQLFAVNNDPLIDTIFVVPNADDSGTDLSVDGGLQLFDFQQLVSSNVDFNLFTDDNGVDFVIPGTPTPTGLGPLISNSTNQPGDSVIQLASHNTVQGFRIDGSNATGTAFGDGITSDSPITGASILDNTFTNTVNAVNLQEVSGDIEIARNNVIGFAGISQGGLVISTENNSVTNLLVQENTVNGTATTGIQVTATQGSILNADNTTGFNGIGNAAIQPTGILDNIVTNSGDGIAVLTEVGAEVGLVAENNTSTGNTGNGFFAQSDDALFNLRSLRGNNFSDNGVNGAFLNYINGGRFFAISEDANGDGVADATEVGGNNLLDLGIVSNTFNNNLLAGICIVGEDDSIGEFDIGGPTEALGNELIGNQGGGILVDLQDSATGQLDVVFNTISAAPVVAPAAPNLTFVLDFIEDGQNVTDPFLGGTFGAFDVTDFGFAAGDFGTVTNAILDRVETQFQQIPTIGQNALSPIADGERLAIDFVIGDFGVAPTNGATEFFFAAIGENPLATNGLLGLGALSGARDINGNGPNFGLVDGDITSTIYSNGISGIGTVPPPSTAPVVLPSAVALNVQAENFAPNEESALVTQGLNTGNIAFTTNAVANVISHEIGHALSLDHITSAGSVTPNGAPPILGTGALDATAQDLVSENEFSFSGVNGENMNAPATNVAQLLGALGTVSNATTTAGSLTSGEGILVTANSSARLLPSTFTNNTITNNTGGGISVHVSEDAVAEGLTIQTNTITGNGGRGVDLVANGSNTSITADGIGGTGINTLQGGTFGQGNTINNNGLDGIRALAQDDGSIFGAAVNNQLQQNGGNGIALITENGGTVDFGNAASNRMITGNTITDNVGAGVLISSNASATTTSEISAIIQGNDISTNGGGGIFADLTGTNNAPPALPAVPENNIVNLTIGGTDTQTNTISGNSDVGIGVNATGTSLINLDIENQLITGTIDGAAPLLDGDGIGIRRADSALVLANINSVTSTGNAGDGLDVETQGNNRNDPSQPLSGTINTINVANSDFSTNDDNGIRFRTRGDSQLLANGDGNVTSNNGLNGIFIQTTETSEFGESVLGIPSVFNGTTSTGNAIDGLSLLTQDNTRALVEITSNQSAGSSAAHAAVSTAGNSSFSDNGRDGIRIVTQDTSISDVLITAGTALAQLNNNGTNGGGNGLRIDASDLSQSDVVIELAEISGNIAGATANPANFGNGVLDPGEDVNRNGILDTNLAAAGNGIGGEDGTNNDLDTEDGDGIQFNVFNQAVTSLTIGGVGRGNVIQNNGDDGIAITATGTGGLQPNITIVGNTIGGLEDGIQAGNGGDGVSVNVLGGTAGGTPSGPELQFVLEDNLVTNNSQRGVNLLLTGAAGVRDRENGNALFDPGRFTLTNNIISSNGTEGVFFRGDAELNQNRAVLLPNFPFPNPPFNPANQRPLDAAFYDPNLPEFQALNNGSLAGQSAFASVAPDGVAGFLNLRTVQNSFLTVENNTVQNNGVGGVRGEGVVISVGTGSYLAADVRDNVFGGNLEEDFRTESFLSLGQTLASIDVQGAGTFDTVFLDDSAQLDLRFLGNTGNQIAISSNGATFTNADPLKQLVLGGGVTSRDAAFFQVDNGINLNAIGNDFVSFGIAQQLDTEFANGGFNLRNVADPLFPNDLFAPFLP